MITNFQLLPRKCKYHSLSQEFICLNRQCQYRALLCSQCTRQNHGSHLIDIRSIDSFIESFRQKVKFYETQFDKDKVVINVKEIIRSKLNQLDQCMNQLLVQVVKMLEKEKEAIREKLLQVEERFEAMEAEYKKNLQARWDCLEYLAAYKNSPKALQARLMCSSEWGIVSLKNSLTDIKNLSINQGRNVNIITETIMQDSQKILKQDNFLYSLKGFIREFSTLLPQTPTRNARITSFIEKSFISTNTNPTTTMINTPKSSRIIEEQRPRTFSLSNANIPRPVSNQNITSHGFKQPSIQKISQKMDKISSQSSLENNKYMKGMRKLRLENVIIRR